MLDRRSPQSVWVQADQCFPLARIAVQAMLSFRCLVRTESLCFKNYRDQGMWKWADRYRSSGWQISSLCHNPNIKHAAPCWHSIGCLSDSSLMESYFHGWFQVRPTEPHNIFINSGGQNTHFAPRLESLQSLLFISVVWITSRLQNDTWVHLSWPVNPAPLSTSMGGTGHWAEWLCSGFCLQCWQGNISDCTSLSLSPPVSCFLQPNSGNKANACIIYTLNKTAWGNRYIFN